VDPHAFVQKVAATIKRHGMADPGDRLLVGVSGGADSVCLARVLHALGFRPGIGHVNHGLRGPDSDEDERFVAGLAAGLGVPFFSTRIRAGELTGNLEAASRERRRAFLDEVRQSGFRRVALAHSRDDRAETLLLNLLRGSGLEGLVAMEPVNDWLIRPLIETTRGEIEAYLQAIGQSWREDLTNQDLRFARNRIRHQVLPDLASGFNPRLSDALARTIDILTAENVWMDRAARDWVRARFSPGPPALLQIGDLLNEPVGFVRRVLRAALEEAGSDLTDVGFDHLEQVRRVLEPGKSGKVIELPGTIRVERSFDRLLFGPDRPEGGDYEYTLPIPGRVGVPEAGLEFEARLIDRVRDPGDPPGARSRRASVDGEYLGPYVKIRNWKHGDTYDPAGLGKSKLKALFRDARIPRSMRRNWPVFVVRSSIVWVTSFPVSDEFVPTERSRRIIEFEAFPTLC
jgi:tRNA(Ile)-lysidine synthase